MRGGFFFFIFLFAFFKVQADFLKPARKWIHRPSKALSVSKKIQPHNLKEQALLDFFKGQMFLKKQQYRQALKFFKKSIENNISLKSYAYWYMGKAYLQLGRLNKAQQSLQVALSFRPPRRLSLYIRFDLAKVALAKRHWRTAYRYLRRLERSWRGTHFHPEILWMLTQVEIARHRSWRSCFWARKLFYRYPTFDKIETWGVDLRRARVGAYQLSCDLTYKDMIKRIRYLQWQGLSVQAREEIRTYLNLHKDLSSFQKESL
ncbi:MAG: hypothetical protein D6797_02275, partial [Bdellovibrio sp.]